MLHSVFLLSLLTSTAFAQLCESNLKTYVGSLALPTTFSPVKTAGLTGLPHHHRTPFAVSPDGKSAYLAYLDASEIGVYVQKVDPVTFKAVGKAVKVHCGREAGGLVAHNDGFALLTNEPMPQGTPNAPPKNTPVAVLYRYTGDKQTFKTFLSGPGNIAEAGALCSPQLNGDLAYSEDTGMYGAYFVVSGYDGPAKGYSGDSLQYVSQNGTLERIAGATSSWGCSLNTGIALEASGSAPFASVCADNQGGIWLNTGGTGMEKTGTKISNEYARKGALNEPMGGISGSYSSLARFINKDSYIFTWVSRGAKDLTVNSDLGEGYTTSKARTQNRNVAIATFSDKKTLNGKPATGQPGANGDSQVNWITTGSADCHNAHVAPFDGSNALVTWEEIAKPTCELPAGGCQGKFTGTYFQLVKDGKKVGKPVKSTNVYVSGDMVTMSDGRVCWPYVDMNWTLDGPVLQPKMCNSISFACMGLGQTGQTAPPKSSSPSKPSSPPMVSSPSKPSSPSTPSSPSKPSTPAKASTPPVYSAPPASTPAKTAPSAPVLTAAPPPPDTSFALFNPVSTPVGGGGYNPYESVYVPASLSFNPILAPAFTNVFPGLPGEFTAGPVFPPVQTRFPHKTPTSTPAAPTGPSVPCSNNGGSGAYGGAPAYGNGGNSPCTLETRVRPSPTAPAYGGSGYGSGSGY
ncbi:uncharacterized protein yc1106_03959 [Curvularia clavata]|uniref:Uncharacterized protein n=1 Tax=Curvularia clavata TaxID=95742 RepID=A0A9Q8Z7M4_CURCL|nr:uncharacterized protein yc1106_03959 [Curvularia clavata]